MQPKAQDVLLALADLAPSPDRQRQSALRVPTDWFAWLPARESEAFAQYPDHQAVTGQPPPLPRPATCDRELGDRLAAIDQVRKGDGVVRLGWLWVAGRTTASDGAVRRVFLPLVSLHVRVQRVPLADARLVPVGDPEVTELITERSTRWKLEREPEWGGSFLDERGPVIAQGKLDMLVNLRAYAQRAAHAAGLEVSGLVPADEGPEQLMQRDGLVVVAGLGVYTTQESAIATRAGSLRAWAEQQPEGPTGFHALYLPSDPPPAPPEEPVTSPYLLTQDQQAAVRHARHAPVTLVSGAPGTGKSHTVAAIACDALARGESVLVTAKADATVDALLDLFERAPGPNPVVFGSSERRRALADQLAGGRLQPVPYAVVERTAEALALAVADERELTASVVARLGAEAVLAGETPALRRARRVAPGLFTAGAELDRAAELLAGLEALTGDGWWTRRRRRRRTAALHALAGAAPDVSLKQVAEALRWARARLAAAELQASGGLALVDDLRELQQARAVTRRAAGDALAAETRSRARLDGGALGAVATLATALRSGRAARREQLAKMDATLTRALPLWAGSLPDIDDLLPPVAGLFDLVILDEASSLDQPLAAPALLRAKRAVVVGDPRQLRHVSFVSDEQTASVLAAHGLDALSGTLDVRRNSVFDVAAGVTPVLTLREHFRSSPHLVDFVADRLYGGDVSVATRRPSTHARDCVEVVQLPGGARDAAGVVREEVRCVLERLSGLLRAGASSVGVLSPFRAQADAIEEAVLAAFTADELEALDLRVGTVHAFQGNERDVVLASLGVGTADEASWPFVADPHLFTVLATRARQSFTVITAAAPPAGLVADYLAQADSPPGPPAPLPVSGWASGLAEELRLGGAPVLTGYPAGRHVLDLVSASRDVVLETDVHPDGPLAHVERHLALLEAGWTVLDAYPSRWATRRAELVVGLLREL